MSRLSAHIRPSEYRLSLQLDPGRDTFEGEVSIRVEARQDETLVLHAEGLTIHEAWVDEQAVAAEPLGPDAIKLGELKRGAHTVRLRWTGGVNPRLRGLYRSVDSEQRPLLVTQMEPNYARLVFPCLDEPEFKAVFHVEVDAPEELTVLSNGAEVSRQGRRVTFAPTPPLPTYLVAVVVGLLEVGSARTVDGVKVRVIATPGKLHLCDYAGDVTEFVLRDYTAYFGQPYPGDKLDLIAVPDFGSGAMENLGAIVFRETRLLVDPDRASSEATQVVAETVSHEVAHQWFGDLVTMEWWEDLWLNEAFATWMETRAMEALRPDWERRLSFGRLREEAMELDGLSSSRPVFAAVDNPNQMAEMFDLITYVKGASVLKMLEEFLGPDVFQRGVARYIAAHAFGNARGADLWSALGAESGRDVSAFTEGWLTRPGYPLLTVRPVDGGLEVSQERFLYSGPEAAPPWPVPLWVVYPDRVERVLMTERRAVYPGAERLRHEHGYYRMVGPTLEGSALERMHRSMDTWALVKAGRLPWTDLIARLEVPEANERVWETYLVALRDLYLCVGPSEALSRVLREAVQQVDAPPEKAALGTLGHDVSLLEWARLAVHDPEQRAYALQVVGAWGGEAEFDELGADWRAGGDPDRTFSSLLGLTWFRLPETVTRLFGWVLSGAVRPQDGGHVLKALLMQREGRALTWRLITENWDELVRVLPMQGMRLVLQGVAYQVEAEGVAEFLQTRPVEGGVRLLSQSLEQLAIRRRLGQVTA